jgi:hypothetical protein
MKPFQMQKTKIALFFMFFCLLSCHDTQNEITQLLTNNSIQYWNIVWHTDTLHLYRKSYSFSKTGFCEKYAVDVYEKRIILPYDTIPDMHGECDKWHFINDSTIYIRGSEVKIASYSQDSIVFKNKDGSSRYTLYRFIGPFRVDPKSLRERDSLITHYAKCRERDKGAMQVFDNSYSPKAQSKKK